MRKVSEVELQTLIEAGAVRGVTAIADGQIWYVIVKVGMSERVLSSQRRERRTWKKLDTLVQRMRSLGISRIEVDASQASTQSVVAA